MNESQVLTSLRLLYSVPTNANVVIEERQKGGFMATVLDPTGAVSGRFIGYERGIGQVVVLQATEVPEQDRALFETVVRTVCERLDEGEASGQRCFAIIMHGEFPELLEWQSLEKAIQMKSSLAGSARDGKLSVWHAIEDMVKQRGYVAVVSQRYGEPVEIAVMPRN